MNKIKYWFQNARAVALPQSMLPAIVAFCMAIRTDDFSIILGIFAVFGVAFAHLSVNLFDDYFDYINNYKTSRETIAENTEFVRVAKSPYLYSGEVSQRKLFFIASLFAVIALLFGIPIFVKRGITPLIIAIIAGILGFFYSAEPLKLCYRGLGEIVTGITFGPLLMSGVFYSASGIFTSNIRIISSIIGLLVVNILFTHSIMDYNPDKKFGKTTLAGLLKTQKRNLAASAIFNFLPYLIIIVAIICKTLPVIYLLSFLVLPRSVYLFYLIYEFYSNPSKQFTKRWWMGMMENWNIIEEKNMQWFAIRWYLSRNILQLFCLCIIICSLF